MATETAVKIDVMPEGFELPGIKRTSDEPSKWSEVVANAVKDTLVRRTEVPDIKTAKAWRSSIRDCAIANHNMTINARIQVEKTPTKADADHETIYLYWKISMYVPRGASPKKLPNA